MRALVLIAIVFGTSAAAAAPIDVAGYTFADGERAFVDDGAIVSGAVTGISDAEAIDRLTGADLGLSIRVITPDEVVVELIFTDNAMVNGPGTDLVIFERSGSSLSPGTPDPNERFAVSIFDGTSFSPFVDVDPVATGFPDPLGDPTIQTYVVEIDLSNFGLALGITSDRFRIHLVDNLASRSADPMGAAALNSVPEPAAGALLLLTSVAGLACRLTRRCS